MLESTKAIILSSSRTTDDKLIVSALTENFGKTSYVLYGAQSKRGGHKASLIFPLSIVTISADHKRNKDLHIAKSIQSAVPLIDILMDPSKSTVAIFTAEVIRRSIHHGEESPTLFSYLENSILVLENLDTSVSNFHISLLVGLSRLIGISPDTTDRLDGNAYFDLEQSHYLRFPPFHRNFLLPQETRYMEQLLRINYRNMSLYHLTREQRRTILEKIISYYKLHIPAIGEIKSLATLVEMYDF